MPSQESDRHPTTIKFGHSDAVNNPPCLICRRPADADDWSVRIISRREVTQLWFTWHEHCLGVNEVEFDYDVVLGEITSAIGYA